MGLDGVGQLSLAQLTAKCTPQDPLQQFGISEEARFQLNSLPKEEWTACVGSQLAVLD